MPEDEFVVLCVFDGGEGVEFLFDEGLVVFFELDDGDELFFGVVGGEGGLGVGEVVFFEPWFGRFIHF